MPVLHYVHDPLCGWCYAAGPMVEAAEKAGISIVLHGGGLWASPTQVAPDRLAYIRQSDAHIAELTGVTFGVGYLDGLLMDPDTIFWSRPTIAALLAAAAVRQGADLRMLHAIQRAHYVAGRRVVKAAVLTDLAGSIGLAVDDFQRSLEAATVDDHIVTTQSLMQHAGLRGFPGFLLEQSGDMVRIDHEPFYGRPDDFVSAVKAAGLTAT